MKETKCLRYIEPEKPVIEYIKRKTPGPDEVGIDIISSSLCNTSELRSFRGGYENGYGSSYPMQYGEPGHEAVGKITSVGSDVKGFGIGDLVAMTGHGGDPCHRSHVIRNFRHIALLKPGKRNVSDAAMLEMFGCAYHCAVAAGSMEFYKEKSVLVTGLGSMGLCTVQILRNIPGISITASDIVDERLEIAIKCGAEKAIHPENAGGETYDVVIECSGSVPGQELAFRLAPRTLIFSSYSTKEVRLRQNLLFDANTTIYNPGILTSENFIKVVSLYNKGKINPSLLVSNEINADIEEYNEAIEEIVSGKIIKTIMKWK